MDGESSAQNRFSRAELGFGVNMNKQVQNAQESQENQVRQYFDDMVKLTP